MTNPTLPETDLVKVRTIRQSDLEQISKFEGNDVPAHEVVGWAIAWIIFQEEDTGRLWKMFMSDYALATTHGIQNSEMMRAQYEEYRNTYTQLFVRQR